MLEVCVRIDHSVPERAFNPSSTYPHHLGLLPDAPLKGNDETSEQFFIAYWPLTEPDVPAA